MTGALSTRIADTVAERHFWLTQGMARIAGVSLTGALATGSLSRGDFADMVVRCGSCEFGERCVRYMAGAVAGDGAAPGYCLNHERIEALRSGAAR